MRSSRRPGAQPLQAYISDPPWYGIQVRLYLSGRRFFCYTPKCDRKIFTERILETALPYGRRTQRVASVLQRLGLALGGEARERLAQEPGMRTSPDTPLRWAKEPQGRDLPAPR